MEKTTLITFCCAALLLGGCAAPTVNLATSEPIKVNIDMRLDVYQHAKASASPKPATPTATDPESARRNRMADIQNFKNSRVVGENRDGLLTVRVDTPGDYGDYIRKTVAAENDDRMVLMKAQAEREKIPLPDVMRKQGELWSQRSFRDEWIETAEPDGSWTWVQKQ